MPNLPTQEPLNQTQIDHLELASTEVSPRTAKLFSLAFAFVLFAVPVSQAVVEIRQSQLAAGARACSSRSSPGCASARPGTSRGCGRRGGRG